jgi:hypothetical protein
MPKPLCERLESDKLFAPSFLNLDNWTTLVLNNAGQVFNYLLIPTSSGYLNKFRVSQRIVGSGYLRNFNQRTMDPEFSDSKNYRY